MNTWCDRRGVQPWQMNFDATYLLHAFHKSTPKEQGFSKYPISYIKAKSSNYAIAVYPIVKHAIDHGVIPDGDV